MNRPNPPAPAPGILAIVCLARDGDADAQALLGQILLDGRSLPPDPVSALSWFLEAARAGHAMARNMVGRCCENGWGIDVDMAAAALWYRRAAMQGLDWGMYNYATSLTLGRGLAPDRTAAFGWFSRAASLGHAKSLNILGGFHEDGWVVARDPDRALALYRQASDGGDFRGHFNLARLLAERGDGPVADLIARARRDGTPAFRVRLDHYLAHASMPSLRALAPEPVTA